MKLYKLNDDKYMLISGHIQFEGTKEQIIRYMVNLGISEDEVFMGLNELEQNDVANYGINWKFLFAKKVA